MESRKPTPKKKRGRPPLAENRARTRNLVIRLSDQERTMLDRIAEHHGMTSATEAFRFLVHREADAIAKR